MGRRLSGKPLGSIGAQLVEESVGSDDMTKLLEKAFEEAAKLPDDDQNAPTWAVRAELASERRLGRIACRFRRRAIGALPLGRAANPRALTFAAL